MTAFVARDFRFELPGDDWEESTTIEFRPNKDPRRAFALTRQLADPDHDLVASVLAMPTLYEDRRIVRSEHRQVGPLEAQEVSVIARSRTDTDYHRLVSIVHYDKALNFHWVGPAEERSEIDARADAVIATLRFRRR